jgi:two-component system osmolarity sensor histidine kinase EnvZ
MALIGDLGSRIRLPRFSPLRRVLPRLGVPGVGPALTGRLPKGLYARSILIVVLPMVILQSVVAYVFLERHWQTVTRRLSSALTRDIAALIDVIETYEKESDDSNAIRIARSAWA